MNQPVPLNDLRRRLTAVQSAIEPVLLEAVRSGVWLNGRFSSRFAADFAKAVGCSDCLLVANGTDALEIALRSIMQVRRPTGREIITVANAGGYTTVACRQLELVPVYADIEEESQLLSIDSALGALNDQTAAIVVTHLYGGVVNVNQLRAQVDSAGYHHVPIIEDCAQAHGARVETSFVGSMGSIATFSFYPTKNLGAFGDAGAIVSSDQQLLSEARVLHQYGWSAKYNINTVGGRNSRIDEIQAAILTVLLPNLEEWNDRRRQILGRYRECGSSSLKFVDGGPGSVAHLAVAMSNERERFRHFLLEKGIATDVHYPILDCDQAGWRKQPMRMAPGGIPTSKASVSRIVTLPCFPEMTDDEVSQVCSALRQWHSQ